MDNPSFQLTALNTGLVLKLTGQLFRAEAEAFDPQIERIFDQKPEQLVVDLSDLFAISSAGLGVLLKLQSFAKQNQCGMRLTTLQPNIEAIVRNASLDRVFTIA